MCLHSIIKLLSKFQNSQLLPITTTTKLLLSCFQLQKHFTKHLLQRKRESRFKSHLLFGSHSTCYQTEFRFPNSTSTHMFANLQCHKKFRNSLPLLIETLEASHCKWKIIIAI